VALPHEGPNAPLFRDAGANTHFIELDLARLRHPKSFFVARDALRKMVELENPDLIHSHFVGTTMFARLALGTRHSVPRIFQVPGPLHLENRITRIAEVRTAGAKDYWLASCEYTRDVYRAMGIGKERVGLSYYGADPISPQQPEPAFLRRELGAAVAPHTRIIGMVAFAYPPRRLLGQKRGLKGHEDLIDAVRLLLDRGRDVHLAIVGGAWLNHGWYFDSIVEYGRRMLGDRVTFLGSRRDVYRLYPGFDVAVHPSHSENVGGAAESLLLGVPTVASNVGGFPDVVRPNETGWLSPPRSPTSLAEAIDEALSDQTEAHRRARAGQALVRHLFDVERTGRETLAFYQDVLADARAREL
jgi:glycosyltransferase involved in cell wall biosynthesis